jgi:hypothetical protein
MAKSKVGKAITPGGRVGDDSPLGTPGGKQNWVDKTGGLPKYIRMVAHAMQRKGKSESQAIQLAIGIVKNWAEGKGDVSPKVRAAAAAAIAEWERKKVQAHVSKSKKPKIALTLTEEEFDLLVAELFEEEEEMDSHVEEFEAVGKISKVDNEKRLVFGWLSVGKKPDGTVIVDKQGDVLDDNEEIEKSAYSFVMNSRDGGEMHVRKGVSTMVESLVSTPEKRKAMGIPEGVLPDGWWGGFYVKDDEVWKGVKSGKYKMFSVHGKGVRKEL